MPSTTQNAPVEPASRFSPTMITVVLCLGSLSGALMQSLVIPIQSDLPRLLGTSAANASWAITATLLAAAVTMPVTGRLADMYGKKRILVASAAILAGGSLVAALSSTVLPFLVGRALQGVAMGYIPVAISLVRETAAPEKQAGAVATVSATLGVGGALGLPLSAWIAQDYSWHGLFWVSTGLALVILALTAIVVPHIHEERPAQSLDVVGIIGLAIGLCSFLIGVSKGSGWGWTDPLTLGCIIGGIVVLLAWGAYELNHHDPLVDLRTNAERPVLFTNLAAVLIGFGMMAQSIVVPQLLQMPAEIGGMGQTILQAGLWMAPAGLMMLVFAPISSLLLNSVGARITLSAGAFITGAGYVVATFLMDAPWQLMVASIVASAGVGIGYAAMPTLILDNVRPEVSGSSVGVNSLMRSVGTTIAGAVMAAVLTSRTTDLAPGISIPTDGAFQLCFVIGAFAAVSGALVALLVPRLKKDDAGAQLVAEIEAELDGQTVTA